MYNPLTRHIFNVIVGQYQRFQPSRRFHMQQRHIRQPIEAQIQILQVLQPLDRIDADDLIVAQIQMLQRRHELQRTNRTQPIIRKIHRVQLVPRKAVGEIAATVRDDLLDAVDALHAAQLLQVGAHLLDATHSADGQFADLQAPQIPELGDVDGAGVVRFVRRKLCDAQDARFLHKIVDQLEIANFGRLDVVIFANHLEAVGVAVAVDATVAAGHQQLVGIVDNDAKRIAQRLQQLAGQRQFVFLVQHLVAGIAQQLRQLDDFRRVHGCL